MDNEFDCVIKHEKIIYKIKITKIEEDKLILFLKNENEELWSLEADITKFIDLDKNWKKFEIHEIQELIIDCLNSSQYVANITDGNFHFIFNTLIAKKEAKLNLKLPQIAKTQGETKTDETNFNELLKEIQNLKLKRKYHIISKKTESYGFEESGYLHLNNSSDVYFAANFKILLDNGCNEWVDFFFSCYNEDLKEMTIKDKLICSKIYRMMSQNSKISFDKDENIKFIEYLPLGKNKITLKVKLTSDVCFCFVSVIAKIQ